MLPKTARVTGSLETLSIEDLVQKGQLIIEPKVRLMNAKLLCLKVKHKILDILNKNSLLLYYSNKITNTLIFFAYFNKY